MSARIKGIEERGLLGRAAGPLVLCGSLIAAAPVFGQPATAQTNTDQTVTAQASASSDVLQEVVVTAERRATDIMTTPVSIVAVSGDQLQSTQIVDLNSLGQIAPNVLIYNSGTATTADIRGVGNSNQGGAEEPGVAVIRDGLPNASEGLGENQPYYDIADVEVLRGPQGTFTGDNSTGGAINITSRNPNFDGINGYLDGEVATYSEHKLDGAVNLPVTDTFAMRFAFNQEARDSFFYDKFTQIDSPYELQPALTATGISGVSKDKTAYDPGNVNDKDMRLGLLWKPTNNFQSLTKIELDDDDSSGVPKQPDIFSFSPLGPGLPCPTGDGTAPNCHNIYEPGYSGSPYVLNNWDSAALYFDDDVNSFSEELRYTLPSDTVLRLLAGDQEISENSVSSTSSDTLNVGSYSQSLNQVHIYSGELDAISPTTGPFSWITGLNMSYMSWEPVTYSPNTLAPYSPTAPAIGFFDFGEQVRTRSDGIFAQVSWQFTRTLQVVAGARMGWDSQVSHGGTATYRPGEPPISNYNYPVGGPPSDRVPTGKLDINWTPLPGQYFYGFIARGYKPGEENIGVEPGTHYEWVNDYETGWKGRLADGHVQMQLGGYYMQYMDMIHAVFNPEIPTATSDLNIPFSILKGIEGSMQAQVAHFTINLNAAYDKSILGPLTTAATYKFPSGTEFGITPQCGPGQVPNNLPTGCSNYTPYEVTLSGESLPYAPTYTASGTIQYSIPLGGMSLVPRVSYSYRGKAYSDIFENDDYYLLPGYSLWGAYLDWNAGPWTTTVYGTNLANSVYLEGTGLYGDRRQIGLEVHRTF